MSNSEAPLKIGTAATTAGFRNAEWSFSGLPEGTSTTILPLRTLDGAVTNGFLYQRTASATVVCIMHPREFLATHYMIPPLINAGFAVFTQTPRVVGNDLRLEHEVALLDVAAGLNWLRAVGFARLVLLGNSGGSGLYLFYNQQALLDGAHRVERTPGGRPTKLNAAEMPGVDGVVLLSPHPGQGILLMNSIDPSVAEEFDPFSIDPKLYAFASENGFRDPPRSATYSDSFTARYRVAQRDRVARLDRIARERIEERMAARKRSRAGGSDLDRVRGAYQSVMTIWRTDADLRCWDMSMDPSERRYGSLWGRDPIQSNWGSVGFARLCTPESWLSTWSGLSSNATVDKCAPAIEQPTLMVTYSGDNTLFPGDAAMIFASIGTSAKQQVSFRGDHHGQPLTEGEEAGRIGAARAICDWLAELFPPH